MNPQTKKYSPALLLPVALACGSALMAWAWLTGGAVWHRLIFLLGQDARMDFFNCIVESSTLRVYEVHGSIYPPLGNLVFYALSKLLPLGMDARILSESAAGSAVYFGYTVTTLAVLAVLVAKLVGGSRTRQIAAGALCLATEPLVYAVERGNIVLWAAVFCAAFLLWYRSASRTKRELSLFCLALAANLKIYPALLGVLLLSDRTGCSDKANAATDQKSFMKLHALMPRWKDALRCAVYATALFFIPFVWMGGIAGLQAMLDSIVDTSKMFLENGFAYKIEFRNTLGILNTLAFGQSDFPVQSIETGARVLALAGVFCFPFLQGHFRKVTMLCALLVGIPSFSYQYNLVFMLPAAALFFSEEMSRAAKASINHGTKATAAANGVTLLYAVLFAAVLIPMPFAVPALTQTEALRSVSLSVVVSGTGLLLMPIVLVTERILQAVTRQIAALRQ